MRSRVSRSAATRAICSAWRSGWPCRRSRRQKPAISPPAVRLAGESRAAAIASGNPWTAGAALYVLGYLAIRNGDLDEANRLWEEGATEHVYADPWAISIFKSCLVGLRAVQQRHVEVKALAAQTMALCQDLEDPVRTAWCLDSVASALAAQGQPLRAACLWGASAQLLDSSAALLPPSFAWVREHFYAGAQAALGEAAFQSALAEGRAMSMRQAIQYALEASRGS